MLYSYYCNYCGKELTQDTVLFDMQYLLTQSKERTFHILKFRMTQAELKALIASGTPTENGYRKCELSFRDIVTCISNRNNLNDPMIARLTLAEIAEYWERTVSVEHEPAWEGDLFGLFDDEEEEDEDELLEAPEPYVTPPAIQAIEEKDEWNNDHSFTRRLLRSDFEVLMGLFEQGKNLVLEIREYNDVDNDGENVLSGYVLQFPFGGYMDVNARVCPKCGKPVFAHAGTARQQIVTFIGYHASGKTSTILALTHYAENYMITGFGSDIWDGSKIIDSVATVEVLDKSDELEMDLRNYNWGIAPHVPESRRWRDAYSATFRIKNKYENRYSLLTLLDLPGEFCLNGGAVDPNALRNVFPEALTCDALVVCLDTRAIVSNDYGIVEMVRNFCSWVEGFRNLWADHNRVNSLVPTMVLFNKCPELEEGQEPPLPKRCLLPLDKLYYMKDEKQHIQANRLYSFVRETFLEIDSLGRGYHAMMRCSPYGYDTRSRHWVERGEWTPQQPTPKNIDLLMRWILSVTGCIPTEASFAINPTEVPYWISYIIRRPQLRSQNPLAGEEIEESLARCALFENPGYFDEAFATNCSGSQFRRMPIKFESIHRPDTNDRE